MVDWWWIGGVPANLSSVLCTRRNIQRKADWREDFKLPSSHLCDDGSHLIELANNTREVGDSTGKKNVTCLARDGRFKGELILVEESFICDNSLQCEDGADETGCDEEYVRKKIFTINDKHRCNSVYLNFTRPDGSTGRFYPERGIR